MRNKKLFIGIGAVAAVAVISVIAVFLLRGNKGYRDIVVFDLSGTVKAVRSNTTMNVAKNMKLKSGDEVKVGEGGFLRLRLDDDKYVFADSDTTLVLEATGTAANSRTVIYVAEGTMVTEVEKKLEGDSSFEIVTPNTTMAIRGTDVATNVQIGEEHEDGTKDVTTTNIVNSGLVETTIMSENGAVSSMMEAGESYSTTSPSEVEQFTESAKEIIVKGVEAAAENGHSLAKGLVLSRVETESNKTEEKQTKTVSEMTKQAEEQLGVQASDEPDLEVYEKLFEKIEEVVPVEERSEHFSGALKTFTETNTIQKEIKAETGTVAGNSGNKTENGQTGDAAKGDDAGTNGNTDNSGNITGGNTAGDQNGTGAGSALSAGQNAGNLPGAAGTVSGLNGAGPAAGVNGATTGDNSATGGYGYTGTTTYVDPITGQVSTTGYDGSYSGANGISAGSGNQEYISNTPYAGNEPGGALGAENRADEAGADRDQEARAENTEAANGEKPNEKADEGDLNKSENKEDADREKEEKEEKGKEEQEKEEKEQKEKEEKEKKDKEEKDKKEQEKKEKEEKEKKEKEEQERLEKEEQERLEKEEQERLEKEEKEKKEKEEKEKKEKEKKEKEEQERLKKEEQERKEKEEQERLEKEEQERKEKEEQERLEKEEQERKEKEEQERLEKEEQERKEKEAAENAAGSTGSGGGSSGGGSSGGGSSGGGSTGGGSTGGGSQNDPVAEEAEEEPAPVYVNVTFELNVDSLLKKMRIPESGRAAERKILWKWFVSTLNSKYGLGLSENIADPDSGYSTISFDFPFYEDEGMNLPVGIPGNYSSLNLIGWKLNGSGADVSSISRPDGAVRYVADWSLAPGYSIPQVNVSLKMVFSSEDSSGFERMHLYAEDNGLEPVSGEGSGFTWITVQTKSGSALPVDLFKKEYVQGSYDSDIYRLSGWHMGSSSGTLITTLPNEELSEGDIVTLYPEWEAKEDYAYVRIYHMSSYPGAAEFVAGKLKEESSCHDVHIVNGEVLLAVDERGVSLPVSSEYVFHSDYGGYWAICHYNSGDWYVDEIPAGSAGNYNIEAWWGYPTGGVKVKFDLNVEEILDTLEIAEDSKNDERKKLWKWFAETVNAKYNLDLDEWDADYNQSYKYMTIDFPYDQTSMILPTGVPGNYNKLNLRGWKLSGTGNNVSTISKPAEEVTYVADWQLGAKICLDIDKNYSNFIYYSLGDFTVDYWADANGYMYYCYDFNNTQHNLPVIDGYYEYRDGAFYGFSYWSDGTNKIGATGKTIDMDHYAVNNDYNSMDLTPVFNEQLENWSDGDYGVVIYKARASSNYTYYILFKFKEGKNSYSLLDETGNSGQVLFAVDNTGSCAYTVSSGSGWTSDTDSISNVLYWCDRDIRQAPLYKFKHGESGTELTMQQNCVFERSADNHYYLTGMDETEYTAFVDVTGFPKLTQISQYDQALSGAAVTFNIDSSTGENFRNKTLSFDIYATCGESNWQYGTQNSCAGTVTMSFTNDSPVPQFASEPALKQSDSEYGFVLTKNDFIQVSNGSGSYTVNVLPKESNPDRRIYGLYLMTHETD